MSINETHARLKSRIWQEIAQTELDLSSLSKDVLEQLVDLTVDAALLELDKSIDDSVVVEKQAHAETAPSDEDDYEEVLWEGRPFLSLRLYYVITDERIRIREGLFGKVRADIELVRVQDVDYTQSFGERMLKLGDITIRSHEVKNPIVEMNNISDPEKVHEIIRRAVLKARKRHRLSYREEM